ncbi:MAG: CerR family C-terminal domain-containing protein [Chthoniobacterales bacterium]|nr:CerR family C-terminal domain-containing protein [Chthoniobacterales bacterium]
MAKRIPPAFPSPATDPTQTALLEAAGEIFARRGYEAATVAEITKAARANVASVNYHFGDKLALYIAVVRHSLPPTDVALAPETATKQSPEKQFTAFVIEFVRTLIGEGRPSWCSRLMAREIAQPTPALPEVIRQVMQPRYDRLRAIIGDYLGESPASERVRFAAHSVIAQCVHWAHAQPLFPHIWPKLRLNAPQVERIAQHIARFSLAGLRSMRTRGVGHNS